MKLSFKTKKGRLKAVLFVYLLSIVSYSNFIINGEKGLSFHLCAKKANAVSLLSPLKLTEVTIVGKKDGRDVFRKESPEALYSDVGKKILLFYAEENDVESISLKHISN